MYKKIEFDVESVTDEDLVKMYGPEIPIDEIIDTYYDDIINKEIQYLPTGNIIMSEDDYNNWNKILQCPSLTFNVYDVDENGRFIYKRDEVKYNLNQEITSEKGKVIQKYFQEKGIRITKVKNYLIEFICPTCTEKNTGKMYIYINSFHIGTHSKSDCENEKHYKAWRGYQKDLKQLWNESKQKKQLIFNLNIEYIEKTIINYFPDIIRCEKDGLLWVYDDDKKHYTEMIDNDNKSDLEELIYSYFMKENNSVLTIKEKNDIKNYIKKKYEFPKKNFASCHLLNVQNGVFDILNNRLLPHSKKYFFTYKLNIIYNSGASTEILNRFLLNVITEKDPITLVKRILGHLHYQGDKSEKGFLFKGTKHGRNGKGTLVKLIRAVIGENRTVTMSLNRFQESSFAEYSLKDKAVYIEDDYKADYIDSKTLGLLNSMTTRVETQVHQKNKPEITINYTCVPIIQCNKVPLIRAGDDGGFYSRWVTVNFGNEFGDPKVMDEFLSSKLLNNKDVMSTLLNYMIDGYRQILLRKETDIKGSFFKDDDKDGIAKWKIENNSALQFIDDCCSIDDDTLCSTRDLYLYYKTDWNLGSGKMSEKKFIATIKDELHIETVRKQVNGIRKVLFKGLKTDVCDSIYNL